MRVQLPWQPQSSQTSFVLTSRQTLLISSTCTWAYRRWWAILLQWIRHAGLCCQSRTCFLATASESVASYPGHVGGEKCFSPPTWPGYDAIESGSLDTYRRWWTILLQWLRHCALVPGYCIWKCSIVPRPRGRREMFLSSHVAWVRCYWKWITGHLQKVMNNTIAMIKTSCTCSWLLHLKSVASYPGHVGGEQPFSPPMWPGYEATKSEPLDTKCIASVIPI